MKSVYEHAGGDEALHRLEIFYAKALADPVLKSLFTERRPHHIDHLTWFTAGSFGGPDRFTRELGFQHIIDVHRHLKITDEQRERFVALYMESVDEAGLPDDEPFRQAVRSHIEFGARVAQQNWWARDRRRSPSHPQRSALAMARNLWLTRSAARWPEWLAADVHLIDRRVPTASSRSAKQARQQSPATAGWIFSPEGNWVVYAKARQQHAKCATDLFIIARGWSLYGAPWLQPVAIGGKSVVGENGGTKRKPLPAAATSCLRRSMVRSSPGGAGAVTALG